MRSHPHSAARRHRRSREAGREAAGRSVRVPCLRTCSRVASQSHLGQAVQRAALAAATDSRPYLQTCRPRSLWVTRVRPPTAQAEVLQPPRLSGCFAQDPGPDWPSAGHPWRPSSRYPAHRGGPSRAEAAPAAAFCSARRSLLSNTTSDSGHADAPSDAVTKFVGEFSHVSSHKLRARGGMRGAL